MLGDPKRVTALQRLSRLASTEVALGDFAASHLFHANRANPMRKVRSGLFVDVLFYLMPVILVVADALAIHANRQQTLEFLDV